MNKKMVFFSTAKILQFEAGLMLLPAFVSIFYAEGWKNLSSFLISIAIILLTTLPFTLNPPKDKRVYAREGLVSVALTWIGLSFFGGLPFFISGQIPSMIDAFFETSSGLTTTGSSILDNVEALSHSMLFWRSFTHFIGGMGVLVLALAVFPDTQMGDIQFMKAEVPGPQFGKLMSKLKSTAQALYIIYMVLTLILFLVLVIAGMPVFDSLLHAFGTAGTGGFGIKNGGVAPYNSPLIEVILGIGMLVFGVNFNIYYFILIGKAKDALKSEELKVYLGIVIASIIMIFLNIMNSYSNNLTALRDSFFTVSSIVTTTGFSTADFDAWPLFSKNILLLLMFIGGMAGSTAGGLKVSRVMILFKSAKAELKRMISHNRYVKVTIDKKALDRYTDRSIMNYFLAYVVMFAVLLLLISFWQEDFATAFSSVAATFNNIGPGFNTVGPTLSFSGFNNISKLILSFSMIAGRLELFPILVLFSPRSWKK